MNSTLKQSVARSSDLLAQEAFGRENGTSFKMILRSFLGGKGEGVQNPPASSAEKPLHCYPDFLQAFIWFCKRIGNSVDGI